MRPTRGLLYLEGRRGAWVRGLTLWLLLLQALDVVLTSAALARGHHEGNPLARAVLAMGNLGLVAYKLTGCAVILLALAWVSSRPRGEGYAVAALAWSCTLMLGVVAWNVSVLLA